MVLPTNFMPLFFKSFDMESERVDVVFPVS